MIGNKKKMQTAERPERACSWLAFAGFVIAGFALSGCLSRVDREAIDFPTMPGEIVYHRIDQTQLPPEQAIDALQLAESNCRNAAQNGGVPVVVGSPEFDRCMESQGYRRAP